MTPVPNRVPTPGRIVVFHQGEDATQADVDLGNNWHPWPAMVLEVVGEYENDPATLEKIHVLRLQVFRPGGNHFPHSCVNGDQPGQWSWPEMTSPSNHQVATSATAEAFQS